MCTKNVEKEYVSDYTGGTGGYNGGYAGQSDEFATDISRGGESWYIENVTDGSTSQGVRSGDGYAKITLLSVD